MTNRDTDTISRQATINAIQKHFNPTGAELSPDLASVLAGVGVVISTMPPSPSRPQWIPCSDRLPDEEVLCCDTRGEMIIGYPYQDEESSTGYGAVLDDVVMIDCIAWMPLPEPYKGAEHE